MRTFIIGLALAGALTGAQAAKAGTFYQGQAAIQSVDWDGDRCGPRCQEHREHERHERLEAERRAQQRHHWEERHEGDYRR